MFQRWPASWWYSTSRSEMAVLAAGTPVDDVVPLVDESVVVEPDEHLADGLGKALIHGEAFAAPSRRSSRAASAGG